MKHSLLLVGTAFLFLNSWLMFTNLADRNHVLAAIDIVGMFFAMMLIRDALEYRH